MKYKGKTNRMILELPEDIQMAIRLRAVKNNEKTGQVVADAIQKSSMLICKKLMKS